MPPDAPPSPPPKRRKLNIATKAAGTSSTSDGFTTTIQSQEPQRVVVRSGTPDAKKPKKNTTWTGLETALQGLRIGANSFPPLQSAITTLTTCLEVFQQASTHREEYETLTMELETVANFLEQNLSIARSSRIIGVITSVSRAIDKEVNLLSKIRDGGYSRRIVRASKDEEILVRVYRRITELFSRLQIEIGMDAWSIANEHLVNTRLESLKPAKEASYDSSFGLDIGRRQCTEHTREATLTELYHWSDDPGSKHLYLMDGMAGTGKTTIAYSLARQLEDEGRLGASFFCARTSESCRDANRIIPTIAYQLARYSTAFQSALHLALGADPDLGSRNVTIQFERLFKDPLLQVKDKIPDHVIIVIDALDECNSFKAVGLIFDLLIRSAAELPVKVFITGRPESRIEAKAVQAENVVHVIHLHEIEYSVVQRDIELYLWEELACVEPLQSQITQLATLAGNLFIFASTVVRYIRPDEVVVHSIDRLLTILNNEIRPNNKMFACIDNLYSMILTSALDTNYLEADEIERIYIALWTVICAQEPVTLEVLTILAGLEDINQVLTALKPVLSVVHISERTGLVCALHASFPEYLFHQERSGRFFCDGEKQHRLMAQRCFTLMEGQLRFNICNLQSSYVFDHMVPDLAKRIEFNISAPLAYACHHWAGHLCLAPVSLGLCDRLYTFLTKRMLFWMEVLNLQRRPMAGLYALLSSQRWISGTDSFYDLRVFIHDAIIFVTRFFASPVSLSTPHLYVSALPISLGRVREAYSTSFVGLIWLQPQDETQSVDLTLDTRTKSALTSIALSPDGAQVAAGTNQGTLRLWDIQTRRILASSFVGRANSISVVRFSPDGKRIVCGTQDGSIWTYRYIDRRLIAAYTSLEGHKENVWSLDFSADDKHIISGSGDCSIRIWDIARGCLAAAPCQNHTGAVRSVRLSPDGTKIVSGSDDCSVRLWDIATAKPILGPLEGHTDTVWSVDFSPDGKLLVSGSNDGTLCIWDAICGDLVAAQPGAEGYISGITSVRFSSEGSHVYCGSQDKAFRVWNIIEKQMVVAPLQTHADKTCSLAIFPDGMHILSPQHGRVIKIDDRFTLSSDNWERGWDPNSNPKATCLGFSADGEKIITTTGSGSFTSVWDSVSGELLEGPLKGHLDTPWSVAFPGSNTRIANKSNTVHMWDKNSGTIVAGPFHEGVNHIFHLQPSIGGLRTISSNSTTLSLCRLDENDLDSNLDHVPVREETHAQTILPGSSSVLHRKRLRSAAKRFEVHSLSMWSVALSPDGTRIALAGIGARDHDIHVRDVSLKSPLAGPFMGHSSSIRSVGFSPDGTNIISGSDDKTIRVWDAFLGTALDDPFEGHAGGVLTAVISPDNAYIASGSRDSTVRIWNKTTRSAVTCYKHTDCVWVVDFSPCGTRIVSSCFDQMIIVWNTADGSIIAGPIGAAVSIGAVLASAITINTGVAATIGSSSDKITI
ncbi:Ribosome assembly protein 4 [Rhizoctonia solani]|uniref:Ribosome assembly protein 4 n=1 Tax=Rhizoctonia solani TaxID=456999 RepID=A0A0K6G3S0_9AGAM|nr:Ribosome assembly protein 4 [Rhizoctonia solani]